MITVCGIPKRADGKFYCPYCSFSSDDIENFATSMCWDCIDRFEEAEKLEEQAKEEAMQPVDIRSLREGDVVRVTTTKEVVVATNGGQFSVTGKDGGHYEDREAYMEYNGKYGTSPEREARLCKIELVSRANPEDWPAQESDVWRITSGIYAGIEVHVLRDTMGNLMYYTSGNKPKTEKWVLQNKPELAYRKGDKK